MTIFSYSKYILESVIKSLRMFPFILLHERQSHIEGQNLQYMKLEAFLLADSLFSIDLKGKITKNTNSYTRSYQSVIQFIPSI